MEEITIKDRQRYLNNHYPFDHPPKISEKRCCIQCEKVFTVGDYKVFKDIVGAESICCPNSPDCYGTVIDWIEVE